MKAVVCPDVNGLESLTLEGQWSSPQLGPNDVKFTVKAAALNFPDVLIIEGKYQFQPSVPFVPGGESSGVVIETGAEVKNIHVGDKIVAFDLVGAFAEENVVDASRVMPKPKSLSFEQGAAICETYFTTYHAYVQRAVLRPGETVLVLGAAGGVGSTAVELAKAMGANVIAAAGSDEKLEYTRSLGADHVINYQTTNLKNAVKEITQGNGVDVVYDPVGGDLSELAVRSMAWQGRYLVVGFAAGHIPSIPLNLILLKGCQIVGVFWGAFMAREPKLQEENRLALWKMFEEGALKPSIHAVYPLEDYESAFRAMIDRKVQGKVVIVP
jgi:NADPH2:quinone reductase